MKCFVLCTVGVGVILKIGREMGARETGKWSYPHFALEGSLATLCGWYYGDGEGTWKARMKEKTSEDASIS